MKEFADFLKHERALRRLTQEQMADVLGVTYRAYRNYESVGVNHREPDQQTMLKIAKILDVPVGYLFGENK
jgi:transcriptional regulator with XRE-family HTH domain